MSLSLIIAGVIGIAAIGLIFYKDTWESGLIRVGYILACVVLLVSIEYFFGQTGKDYFAIFLVIAICAVLYIRKKKGHKNMVVSRMSAFGTK